MRWLVGTSGFSYDEWTGSFYPEDLPARPPRRVRRPPAAVEVNNTFYRLPKPGVIAGRAAQAVAGFRFAPKAPLRVGHAKASEDTSGAAARLFQVSAALGECGGPVLSQLPPRARKDVARLHAWLAAVPAGRQVALEVRHPSWLDDEVCTELHDAGAAPGLAARLLALAASR